MSVELIIWLEDMIRRLQGDYRCRWFFGDWFHSFVCLETVDITVDYHIGIDHWLQKLRWSKMVDHTVDLNERIPIFKSSREDCFCFEMYFSHCGS